MILMFLQCVSTVIIVYIIISIFIYIGFWTLNKYHDYYEVDVHDCLLYAML